MKVTHHPRGLNRIQLISSLTDDHNIPEESQPSTATRAGEPSSYSARPAPQTFEEFMAELQRIVGATRFGDGTGGEDVDAGGLMVDEELYEEVFGNIDAMGNG
jgi:hypothetical protein